MGSAEVSLRSILLHEFGHSLGLSHSREAGSIMYAFYQYDLPPKLSDDDVLAVQAVYGEFTCKICIFKVSFLQKLKMLTRSILPSSYVLWITSRIGTSAQFLTSLRACVFCSMRSVVNRVS